MPDRQSDKRDKRRARRHAARSRADERGSIDRTYELFGAGVRFAAASVEPGRDPVRTLLFGRSPSGRGLLEAFIDQHPGVKPSDLRLFEGFRSSFSSLWKRGARVSGGFEVLDLVTWSTHTLNLPSAIPSSTVPLFFGSLMVPVAGVLVPGGTLLPVRQGATDKAVLDVARRLARLEAARVRAAHPRTTHRMTTDLHQAFVAAHGSDHIVGRLSEVLETLAEFHRGYTPPQHEGMLATGQVEAPFDTSVVDEVGLVVDPRWGELLVPSLGALFTAVRTNQPGDLARALRNPEVGPPAFRVLFEAHPNELTGMLAAITTQDDFSWEANHDQLLRELKPGWFPVRSSVLPLPPQLVPLDDAPDPDGDGGMRRLLNL